MEPYRREGGERVGGHGRRARILAAAALVCMLVPCFKLKEKDFVKD